MGHIEAIIFDKDGTLFSFQDTWTVWAHTVLEELTENDTEMQAAATAIGFDLNGGVFLGNSVVIAGTAAEITRVLEPILPKRLDILEVLDTIAADTPQAPVPELHATLDCLSRDHVLGLMTNDSEVPARAHLAQVGIADRFSFVAGYDSGFGAKPEPGPLLAFSDAVGVAPRKTLMVGDSRHDLAAGRAAGMGTVGVLTGVATANELVDLADVILPDIRGISTWLGSAPV
ncbi:MAG: HAD family hydrolase [Boseongicola sp.]